MTELHHEVELAVIIESLAKDVSEEHAMQHVGGPLPAVKPVPRRCGTSILAAADTRLASLTPHRLYAGTGLDGAQPAGGGQEGRESLECGQGVRGRAY